MRNLYAICGGALLVVLLSMPAIAGTAADEIRIARPYVHAVPPVGRTSAVFMTLHNTGDADHAVVAVSSRAAATVELHALSREGDLVRMRPVERVALQAGKPTLLRPGGLHMMLIDLRRPLTVGATVPLTLTFEDGSHKTVFAPVKALYHGEG